MLHSDGALLGIISVDEPANGLRPRDEELDVLAAVAAHAALALQNVQEAGEAARHRSALEQLLQVSARLTDAHDEAQVLREVVHAIHGALGFEKVSIDLLDGETGRFSPTHAFGWDLDDVALSQLTACDLHRLLDARFEAEGCYLLPGDEALARLARSAVSYRSVRNGSGPRAWRHHWLLVPLWDRDGEVFGVIWVDDPADRLLPSRELLQALRMFANQATTSLLAAADFRALFESEQRRLATLEASPLAVFELGLDWRVQAWNPAAERIFGWRADEVLGRPNPIVPDAELVSVVPYYDRLLAGESIAVEVRRQRKGGSLVDVKLFAAPMRDADGEVSGTTVTVDDIDDRKRAEALKSAILEAAPDCVIMVDETGAILEFNPKAEETFGWMRYEALTMSVDDLLVLDGGLEALLPDALLGVRHELVAIRADGGSFPAEVAFAPVRGAGLTVYKAYLRDVS
jgi:PAS domain S-box-containing protein